MRVVQNKWDAKLRVNPYCVEIRALQTKIHSDSSIKKIDFKQFIYFSKSMFRTLWQLDKNIEMKKLHVQWVNI